MNNYSKYLKENFGKKAKEYSKDKERTKELVDKALKKANKLNRGPIADIIENIQLLFGVVRDWATGRYTDIPLGSIIAIIGGILYFLSPIDIIPDFLPGGYIDDAIVLGFVIKQVKSDLDSYKEWRKENVE